MSKMCFFATSFILGAMVLIASSCGQKKTVDYSTMHVYQLGELQKIIDNAYQIDVVGQPAVQKTSNETTGAVTVTTTQIYKVYVAQTSDDRLIPKSEVTASARRVNQGPIIITSACEMTCTPVRPGESCNIAGCMETSKCGCTQGSCGNNCTTDIMCHQSSLTGFGFGRTIIF